MLATDASALAAELDRLVLWLRRQAPPTVSSSTVTALDRLAVEGPLRVTELAAREAMTQPGVTLLVNRMTAAGYVRRVPDPTDGRAALVTITDAGRALLAERNAARAAVLHARLAQLDPDDRRLLTAALPALARLGRPEPNTDGNPVS